MALRGIPYAADYHREYVPGVNIVPPQEPFGTCALIVYTINIVLRKDIIYDSADGWCGHKAMLSGR